MILRSVGSDSLIGRGVSIVIKMKQPTCVAGCEKEYVLQHT